MVTDAKAHHGPQAAQPIRLLLVEDDSSDADLLERFLQRGGLQLHTLRVDSAEELSVALRTASWDLVISDYHLPGFNAIEALALVRRHAADLPFIVVSGLIGEEKAVDLMRAGAQDFVMKNRLARLLPAIERELVEAGRHREQAELAASLAAQERTLLLAMQATGDGVWDCNPQTGAATFSDAVHAMLGYPAGALNGDLDGWRALIHPDDREQVRLHEAEGYAPESTGYRSEHRLRCADGSWKWVLDRGLVIERSSDGTPLREIGTTTDISEVRRAVEALRESHELLQKLTRNVPGMLYSSCLHPDGHWSLPFASAGIERMYGVNLEQAQADVGLMLQYIHADDRLRIEESITRSVREMSPWSQRYRLVLPGQPACWIHGESTPERQADGCTLWHGYARDITSELEAQAELRLLQACVNAVHDAIVVTAVDHADPAQASVVYINPAAERLYGFPATELIGRAVQTLRGPDTDPQTVSLLAQAQTLAQPICVEILNYRKNSEPFWCELAVSPVGADAARITHWVGVCRDVSARRQAHAEREQLIATLETRNSELDAYNHSVAHDLRNPVISIHGLADLAELALSAGDPRRAQECIRKIARCSEQADALIRNLMALARLGRQAMDIRPLALQEWALGLLGDMEFLIAESAGTVQLDIDPLFRLETDEALLRVILGNLIGNALKHQDPRRAPVVTVRLTEVQHGALIEVIDNAVGIAQEAHRRIFSLFERIESDSEGTGVGLAMVDRATRLLGGRVRLQYSQVGVGSCFEVYLPQRVRG